VWSASSGSSSPLSSGGRDYAGADGVLAIAVNHPLPIRESSFSLLFDTRRDVAEWMAECPICGAMTMLPIEIAWLQGVVHCCECGVAMSVTLAVLERLQGQAGAASETIKRLLSESS
jgi:hypothetical protein